MQTCIGLIGNISHLKTINSKNTALLKNMRIRLNRFRKEIDYLLDHPYSTGHGTKANKKKSKDAFKPDNTSPKTRAKDVELLGETI